MLFFDMTSDKDNPEPCYTSLRLNCYLSQDRNLPSFTRPIIAKSINLLCGVTHQPKGVDK